MREVLLDWVGHVWRRAPSQFRRSVLALTQRMYTAGVVGVVPNRDDAVLLLRHRFRVPYAWGLPGGYIEDRESPNSALARELFEELSLRVEVRAGVLEHELNHASHTISYVVLANPVDEIAPALGAELLDFRFCTADDLPAELQPTHARVLERYWAGAREPRDNLLVLPERLE
jgi:8-oxo-dGTP pyrophosphatase MutT (NUDIX family)